MTLEVGDRRNNFDALRLMAALMVIHGHGWMLSGDQIPGLWGVSFARVGLDVFFSREWLPGNRKLATHAAPGCFPG